MTAKEGPGIDLASLKMLFQETLEEQMAPLREELATLRTQVAEVDRQVPKFIKMPQRDNPSGMPTTPAEHLAAMQGMRPGDTHSDTVRSVPTLANGKPMDDAFLKALMAEYAPQFQDGDTVRINPDAQRRHASDGHLWRDILRKGVGNPDGYGVIIERDSKLSPHGHLYRVIVKGHTPERGMMFEQHELLHA